MSFAGRDVVVARDGREDAGVVTLHAGSPVPAEDEVVSFDGIPVRELDVLAHGEGVSLLVVRDLRSSGGDVRDFIQVVVELVEA